MDDQLYVYFVSTFQKVHFRKQTLPSRHHLVGLPETNIETVSDQTSQNETFSPLVSQSCPENLQKYPTHNAKTVNITSSWYLKSKGVPMHACENNTNYEFVIETFPHLMICSKSKEGTNANVIKSAQVTFGFATEAASEERKAEERKRKVRKRNIFDETVLRALPPPASFINIRSYLPTLIVA